MSFYRQGPTIRMGGGAIGLPPFTAMVKKIVIVNVAIWILQFFLSGAEVSLAAWLGLRPAAVFRGFVWQPFTYMWLHGDVLHVLFNMLMLWMFGGDLERHWGPAAFLRYYLVCGVGATVFIMLAGFLGGEANVVTIGASGAIFGLLLAFGVVFPNRVILMFLLFPMPARVAVIIWAAITLFATLGSSGGTVSHIAHLGGMAIGYLYLKRAWRVGELYRDLRWKLIRRRFKVVKDDDDFIH